MLLAACCFDGVKSSWMMKANELAQDTCRGPKTAWVTIFAPDLLFSAQPSFLKGAQGVRLYSAGNWPGQFDSAAAQPARWL